MLSFANDVVPAAENAIDKALLVSGDWRAMFAGDPQHVVSTLRRVHQRLTGAGALLGPKSPAAMQQAFREAYQEEFQQQVTDRFLTPYGWTLEQFRKEAYKALGSDEFRKLNDAIREYDLGLQFLVYGLDPQGLGHIFEVGSPGVIAPHELTGYAVIGSGYYMAMGALAARPLLALPVEELVYRLCEAKFTSETAHGVGRETTLMVLYRNGLAGVIEPGFVENLRQQWELQRKEKISTYLAENIRGALTKGIH